MSFLNPTPPAGGVFYDNVISGLSSEDVNAAIDELAASASPFPLELITALVSVFVPVNRQYHVYQNLTVEGNLTLDGRLFIFV